jgi:hypothetical protein
MTLISNFCRRCVLFMYMLPSKEVAHSPQYTTAKAVKLIPPRARRPNK